MEDQNEKNKPRLAYLCLQATREGQASHAHVHEIIRGLERRGWEVLLFEPSYRYKKSPSFFYRLFWFIFVQIKLWLSDRPHIVYVRHHFAALPTAIWARMKKLPIVQEVNGPYEDLFIAWPLTRICYPVFKWMMKIQLCWANAVIAVTPQLAQWVTLETRNKKVFVIPNGVNVELFKPGLTLHIENVLPKDFVVFFGALAPWQGIDTMLHAIAHREWPAEVKLVVAGDGVEREKVRRAVENGNRIIYLGTVPYRLVPGIVGKSIAGLSPQNRIGDRGATGLFPLKVLETLSCQVPIVLSDFPGIAELIVQNKCGIVIPPEDPEALAKAVKYLYENPNERERMGRAGREIAMKELSWDNRSASTDVVLKELLRNETNG